MLPPSPSDPQKTQVKGNSTTVGGSPLRSQRVYWRRASTHTASPLWGQEPLRWISGLKGAAQSQNSPGLVDKGDPTLERKLPSSSSLPTACDIGLG